MCVSIFNCLIFYESAEAYLFFFLLSCSCFARSLARLLFCCSVLCDVAAVAAAAVYLSDLKQQMYMAAVQQNPAMMLMPYMTQYPMYTRMALPTDVSLFFLVISLFPHRAFFSFFCVARRKYTLCEHGVP